MLTTEQSLEKGFKKDEYGWVFTWNSYNKIGEPIAYELRFEPLLFDKQMYVALYKDQDIMTEKVVVKPGYIKSQEK